MLSGTDDKCLVPNGHRMYFIYLRRKMYFLLFFVSFQNNDSHPKYSPELISCRVDWLLLLCFGFASFGGLFCFGLVLVLFCFVFVITTITSDNLPNLWVRHSSFMLILFIWPSWCMIAVGGDGRIFLLVFSACLQTPLSHSFRRHEINHSPTEL